MLTLKTLLMILRSSVEIEIQSIHNYIVSLHYAYYNSLSND